MTFVVVSPGNVLSWSRSLSADELQMLPQGFHSSLQRGLSQVDVVDSKLVVAPHSVQVNAIVQGATKDFLEVEKVKKTGKGNSQNGKPGTTTKAHAQAEAFGALLSAIARFSVNFKDQQKCIAARQPAEVQLDDFGPGRLVENQLVYRQPFVIRSYEVGADRSATMETLINHFQETALNHCCTTGVAGDTYGTTHAMIRHNLIWAISFMQIQVERYPSWGDVVEMDTWVAASGKHSLRRDWLVRDYKSGEIIARASSAWVLVNTRTRKVCRMPDDVREEVALTYLDRWAIPNSHCGPKIPKLCDQSAQRIVSGLAPRRCDLDINQRVNNLKYINWILASVPKALLESHQLTGLTLDFRREASPLDVVQSLCSTEFLHCNLLSISNTLNRSGLLAEDETSEPKLPQVQEELHLLRSQIVGEEIVRGRTLWRLKNIDDSRNPISH